MNHTYQRFPAIPHLSNCDALQILLFWQLIVFWGVVSYTADSKDEEGERPSKGLMGQFLVVDLETCSWRMFFEYQTMKWVGGFPEFPQCGDKALLAR